MVKIKRSKIVTTFKGGDNTVQIDNATKKQIYDFAMAGYGVEKQEKVYTEYKMETSMFIKLCENMPLVIKFVETL